jgi:hypothetical protein
MVMKLEDVLKKTASAVFTEVVPGGGVVLSAINAMLPSDKQIPVAATNAQVDAAIATLPAPQRAQVLSAEVRLEETRIKEAGDTTRTMLIHDAKNPQSTRPYIAKHSFHVLALCAVVAVATMSYAAIKNEYWIIKSLADSWMLIGAIVAPLVFVLKSYFGAIKTEQEQRLNAANGHPIVSGLSSLIGNIKK